MNGALRQAEAVDPDWARKERRKQFLLMAATGGALVAIAIGTVAFVLGIHNSTEITQIRHSACEVEPEGEACQVAKRESAKAESIATACIPFHQVGYACPKPGSKAAARQPEEVMPSTPHTGHSPSGPSPGGSTDTPSHLHAPSVPHQSGGGGSAGGHEASSPAPAAPTSPTHPNPPASIERITEVVHEAGPPLSAEVAKAPVREVVGGVVEALKPTIEGLGETAGGTVEGVEATTCELAKVLCHE